MKVNLKLSKYEVENFVFFMEEVDNIVDNTLYKHMVRCLW